MNKDKNEDYEEPENWEKRTHNAEKKLEKLRQINQQKILVLEQREKIDTRTNILRVSIGLNCGLIAGLLVHFLARCR